MKITQQDKSRAKTNGINITAYMTKTSLFREIQKHEGIEACFRMDKRIYCQKRCEWGSDCKYWLIAAWKR